MNADYEDSTKKWLTAEQAQHAHLGLTNKDPDGIQQLLPGMQATDWCINSANVTDIVLFARRQLAALTSSAFHPLSCRKQTLTISVSPTELKKANANNQRYTHLTIASKR